MIWIDFGIICIGQEQVSLPSNMGNIIIEYSLRTENSEPFYIEDYQFQTADKLTGCWYRIWLSSPICYEESFFDISSVGSPNIEVVPKWYDCVENLLSFYINESPVKKIAVLLRVEDNSNDVVHSDCSLADFMQKLTDENIRWNELYFVHDLQEN